MVRGDDQGALDLAVLPPESREPEVDEEERDQDQAGEVVERAVDAVLARESVVADQPLLVHAQSETPRRCSVTGGEPPPAGYQEASRIEARSERSTLPGVM